MAQFIGGPFDGDPVSELQQSACWTGEPLKVPFVKDVATAIGDVFGDGLPLALYRPNDAGDFVFVGESRMLR